MSRSVPLWIGKNDDEKIPARVRLRIFDAHSGKCNACGLAIRGKLLPHYDHIIALVNGGRNAEENVQLLCSACHNSKTATDVAEKSVIYNKRAKRLKLKKRKIMLGSKESGWKHTFSHGWIKR